MATLYVENVPDDIYKALRKRARANRKSIAAEVISLLQQFVPTEAELKRRVVEPHERSDLISCLHFMLKSKSK